MDLPPDTGEKPLKSFVMLDLSSLAERTHYIYVFNASFEEQSIHATTSMSYISPWITYRF